MTTITLVQAAAHAADHIHSMTTQPRNFNLAGLTGGGIQFSCTNPVSTLRDERSVLITYDAYAGGGHEVIQISSVMA